MKTMYQNRVPRATQILLKKASKTRENNKNNKKSCWFYEK